MGLNVSSLQAITQAKEKRISKYFLFRLFDLKKIIFLLNPLQASGKMIHTNLRRKKAILLELFLPTRRSRRRLGPCRNMQLRSRFVYFQVRQRDVNTDNDMKNNNKRKKLENKFTKPRSFLCSTKERYRRKSLIH